MFSNVTKQDLIDLGTKILGVILTAVMGWIGLGHLSGIKAEAQAQTKMMQAQTEIMRTTGLPVTFAK